MKRVLAVFFLFAACQVAPTSTRINLEATEGIPGWVAPKFMVGERSATSPVFEDREIVFTVNQGDCSSRADRRGPSDCQTKTTRSVISTGKDFRLGHQYLYSFEFWIDPSLAYPGYRTPDATLTKGVSSRLSIAVWQGSQVPKNQLFDLKVDATRGVTFLGRTCVPPSEFGRWHRFNMRIRWANNDTGFLEVRCDISLHKGKPIFAQSEFSTNQALHCFPGNNCEPGVRKDPRRFEMQLGILFDNEVKGGRAVFPRISPGGLTVKMRRVIERRLYIIFGRVNSI